MKTIYITLLTMLAVLGLWVGVATHGGKSVPSASPPRVVDPFREYIELKVLTGRPLSCKILGKRAAFVQVERERDHLRFIVPLASLDASSRAKMDVLADCTTPTLNEDLFTLAKASAQVEVFYIHEVCYVPGSARGEYLRTAEGVNLDACRVMLKTLDLKYKEIQLERKNAGGESVPFPAGIDARPCIRIDEVIIHERDLDRIKTAIVDQFLRANSVRVEAQAEHVAR